MVQSYKELKVWQKAIELVAVVYRHTQSFPKEEMYGLTSQIRRGAVSIPSNIAEGCERNSTRDLIRFVHIAKGSLAELETQLLIAMKLDYLSSALYFELTQKMAEIGRMLNGLITSLDKPATGDPPLATEEV